MSLGVDGEQDVDAGDDVVWDVEYADDNDLHDDDDAVITLTAGIWMVGYSLTSTFVLERPKHEFARGS